MRACLAIGTFFTRRKLPQALSAQCTAEAAGCFSNGARLQPCFLTRASKTAMAMVTKRCTCAVLRQVSSTESRDRGTQSMHCEMLVSYRPLGQVPEGWRREQSRAVVLADDAVLLASGATPPLCSALQSTERPCRLPRSTPTQRRRGSGRREATISQREAAPNDYGSQ